jgi:hypothetical protein
VDPVADAFVRLADRLPIDGSGAFFRTCVRCDHNHSLVQLVLPVRKFFFSLKQQVLEHVSSSVRLGILNNDPAAKPSPLPRRVE